MVPLNNNCIIVRHSASYVLTKSQSGLLVDVRVLGRRDGQLALSEYRRRRDVGRRGDGPGIFSLCAAGAAAAGTSGAVGEAGIGAGVVTAVTLAHVDFVVNCEMVINWIKLLLGLVFHKESIDV